MAVPLATAFVRLRPSVDRGEFTREAQKAGAAAGSGAGRSYAEGFYRDSQGRLRQANGRFATDAQKAMIGAGSAAGAGFGNNFTKSGGGIIRKGFTKLKGELGPLLVPLGVAGAVAAIGKIGMEYEDNLNIMKSVSGATGAQMDLVAKKARALGADVTLPGVSAAGAAAAMTELSKAGFSVQQSMDAATGTLRLARAAGLSEAQAATITANAVNAFGIAAKDATFVSDELAAAANSSSVEVSDVADAFKMAAASFSGFQGPAVGSKEAITELNTAVAILGNNGIRGSDAGTSLKQMLLQLTGPTQAAKDQMRLLAQEAAGANVPLELQNNILHGSKAVREAAAAQLAKLNPQLKDVGDIAFDSSGKMRPLKDIIALTTAGTKNMTQEERDFALTQIFGADATRSVVALMKGGLPTYEAQRQAVLKQGAAADVAAAKNKGLRGAIDNVRSQLENAAISIYTAVKGPLTAGLNGLAGILAPLAGRIAAFAGWVGRNIGALRDWAIAIGLVTAALKLNSLMLAVQAAGGLAAWIRLIRPVAAATRLWAGAQALLNVTLIANPIGIVITAIAALVGGLIYAYRHSETFRKIVDGAFRGIAAAATWAWNNVIKPVVTALVWYFRNIVAPVALWLWHNVFEPTFHAIGRIVQAAWVIIKVAFAAWVWYVRNVLAPVALWLWRNVIGPAFHAIGAIISVAWNQVIRPIFAALGSFIRDRVAPAFRSGVSAITAAWDKVKAAARTPVAFVVNRVINPLIGGINKAAAFFGVKDRIAPIAGFADGGRIAGLPSRIDNRLAPATIPGVGAVKLAGGEFVVNARDTAKALPILEWINAGMRKGGPSEAARRIGRPMSDTPGDGSEGWAFADGGLVGWVKKAWGSVKNFGSKVWDIVSDPAALLRRPFEAAMRGVPGAGAIRDVLIGAGSKLIGQAVRWFTGAGGGLGGNVGKARAFVQAQAGKPYVWASAGPGGYDCSGIVSAAYNILKGRLPYGHTFSTEQLPGQWFAHGLNGALLAGWSHPGQPPASNSTGHMAGQIAGLPFESRGSRGVVVGSAARKIREFAEAGHARADGGILPVKLFDTGGAWPTGTLGANLSGRTEYVSRRGQGGTVVEFHAHFHGPVASERAAEDMVFGAWKRLKRQRKIP